MKQAVSDRARGREPGIDVDLDVGTAREPLQKIDMPTSRLSPIQKHSYPHRPHYLLPPRA